MPPPNASGYVLAFDFGLRHIGVASGQTITGSATPLTTLRANQGTPDWEEVVELVASWQPLRLLVGLPLNMDDSESEMSERARQFAAGLEQRTGIDADLVDERLTSRSAREQARSAAPLRGRGSASERARSRVVAGSSEHALAAMLIAETWLNQQRASRPPAP
jgi:putative holliday junction resolvase